MKTTLAKILLAASACFVGAAGAWAHAFLNHSAPTVGGSVKAAPAEVSLTFTAALEAGASSVQVFDAVGKEVDQKNLHADPQDAHRLVVSLPAGLAAGTYKVTWRAVSLDTHVTTGDFTFRVEP